MYVAFSKVSFSHEGGQMSGIDEIFRQYLRVSVEHEQDW